ncbi:MAG TPA: alpha/beta hydrolase [Allosphingosinicella sp.]|jgi:pimeloyl-ACP methyl ester carboxylesterase
MAAWADGYWSSGDGLRLHFRDYSGDPSRPPIVCIPGLTRNARDFEGVADRLAGRWRLLCLDLRGRGGSEFAKDAMSYVPARYADDVEALLAEQGLERLIFFGTSLGGIVTMLLAQRNPSRIAGALINDIGPVLETSGLDKIRGYVGRSQNWPTWLHAARAIAEAQRDRYPDWLIEDWIAYAKRLCKLTPNGRVVFDYDMRIADPFKTPGGEAGFDMWEAWRSLAGVPTLLLRGELSDLLSVETEARMKAENLTLETVTVPRAGHAPTLDEPVAAEAIEAFLARLESSAR